jgi:hypothetical protein
MPRIPRGAKTRLNLEMSDQVRKRLEELRDKTDADSLAEVVRKALAVYEFLWTERQNGADLFVRGADEQDRKVVLL